MKVQRTAYMRYSAMGESNSSFSFGDMITKNILTIKCNRLSEERKAGAREKEEENENRKWDP